MVSRREWLLNTSAGFGAIALAGLCAESRAADPLAPKEPHFPARAKRVIFLCMRGGPSQVEMFDYKPRLSRENGQPSRRTNCRYFGSQWSFAQHGQSGLWVSELLPNLARQADRLCVINSMHTDNENHPQALDQLHTGSFQFIRPSMGAWTVYGLGTENRDLPGFISLYPLSTRHGGSAFLPATFQATTIGENNQALRTAQVGNLRNPRLDPAEHRRQIDLIQAMNRDLAARHADDGRLEGVIQSHELAFRMQAELPRVMDLSGETPETLRLYGIDGGPADEFGRRCLLARRFAEAGVRFVQLTHQDWDHHGFVQTLMPRACQQIDRPIAGLLTDLARRGLLEDTLVVWGGEFGRTPDDPTQNGRGHQNKGYTMWLAGGGVKAGHTHGRTDDLGYEAVENKVHLHDLHATILHQLGLDHERLTYRHGGRDFRLTDVHGTVVREIL